MEESDDSMDQYLSSLPKEKWWGDNYLFRIGDFWFTPLIVPNIDSVIEKFEPLPSDVILASFPKTGTTWLKSLIYSIVNRSSSSSSKHDLVREHPHELVPILEAQVYTKSTDDSSNNPYYNSNLDDSTTQSSLCRRRLFSTHISYQLLHKTLDSSQCKVVYVTRNPKDTLVSFWHYVNKWDMAKHGKPWSYEEAVDKFCLGLVPYGPYYEHVLGYRDFSVKMPEKVFFITYEELVNDPINCVERLAEFLGCPFEGDDKKEQVEQVVMMCSFDKLSNYEKNKSEEAPTWCPIVPYSSFFRKGGVGDHKNYLTEEAIERVDSLTKEKFHSSGFMYGI